MLKLPNNIRIQIARKANSNSWKISELLEVIKVEIERMKINESKPTSPSNRPNHITASALTARSSESFKLQCVYCKGEHYSASCKTVKNVRECIDVSTVFEKGHQMKDCQVDKTCRHCNKKHHQSICFSVRENSREDESGHDDLQQRRHDDKMDTNLTVTTVSMS
jgi:hypothetical protein